MMGPEWVKTRVRASMGLRMDVGIFVLVLCWWLDARIRMGIWCWLPDGIQWPPPYRCFRDGWWWPSHDPWNSRYGWFFTPSRDGWWPGLQDGLARDVMWVGSLMETADGLGLVAHLGAGGWCREWAWTSGHEWFMVRFLLWDVVWMNCSCYGINGFSR